MSVTMPLLSREDFICMGWKLWSSYRASSETWKIDTSIKRTELGDGTGLAIHLHGIALVIIVKEFTCTQTRAVDLSVSIQGTMFGIHISRHHNVQWMSDIVTVKRLVTTLPREYSICFPIRIRGELWLQEQGCSQLRQLFLEREEVATCWQRNNYASHKMRDTITKQPQFTQPVICNYCTYSQIRIIKVVEWHAVMLYHKQWKHTTAPSQWPAPATTCLCYKVRLLVPRTTHIHTLSRFTISDGLVRSSHST